jgi:hypothetical protein
VPVVLAKKIPQKEENLPNGAGGVLHASAAEVVHFPTLNVHRTNKGAILVTSLVRVLQQGRATAAAPG